MDRSKTQDLARQALDKLVHELEAGQSGRLKAYLAMLGRFHHYSFGNVLLIGTQFPNASHVAGYRAWQRLGRQVRRGAKAIRILAPIVLRSPSDKEEDDPRVVAFKTACVFDVSQTGGSPLPQFARVGGDPGPHLATLRLLIDQEGIRLQYVDSPSGPQGWSSGGAIGIRRGLVPAEEFSVLVHELAHERLHSTDDHGGTRCVRETEAEAVAFVVCEAVGLDTNTAAADYIQLYDGNRETLLASLDRIQRTARSIIGGLAGSGGGVPAVGGPLAASEKRSAA